MMAEVKAGPLTGQIGWSLFIFEGICRLMRHPLWAYPEFRVQGGLTAGFMADTLQNRGWVLDKFPHSFGREGYSHQASNPKSLRPNGFNSASG